MPQMASVPKNTVSVSSNYECKVKTRERHTFVCDAVITFLSLLVYVADIITDVILGVKYMKAGYFEWGALTLMLCILPSVLTQLVSLRWHQVDQTPISLPMVLSHFSLLGVVHRYVTILDLGLKSQDKPCHAKHQAVQLLYHYQSDVCLLRLFESFLESAPQLLLQLYIMHELGSWHPWTGVCAFGSLLSLACGIASYARTMRNAREDKARITWIGLALQAAWRTGTMISRIFALLLCASVIHLWFLLALTIHWIGMTIWTIKQKTDLCTTAWEERIYNGVVGVIYCFCFFNVKEGQSRQRAILFYTVTAAENAACLAIFLHFSHENKDRQWFQTTATALIIAGSVLGHASQLVYYRWFHPSGPIKILQSNASSIEENIQPERDSLPEQTAPSFSPVFTIRTLKNMNRKFSGVSLASATAEPVVINSIKIEQNEKSPGNGNPIQEILPCLEIENTLQEPQNTESTRPRTVKSLSDSKLLDVTSMLEGVLMPKTKSDGNLVRNFPWLQKRIQGTRVFLSETDSQSVASSASVHDYENMVILNVNRTDWGIRHWKSYSDIETSFHDNSICKERDPLESSITSTSSTDSNRFFSANGKLSIEEAIAQLKSLAVHGHNVYQPDSNASNASKLYEFIWFHDDKNTGIIMAPPKPCPTTGHNLSTITEVSESNSTSSTKSKSSLVQTVNSLMDRSANETCAEDEHLTYVEISFLSKLSESSVKESISDVEFFSNEKSRVSIQPARRQFSIIREKFESVSKVDRKHSAKAQKKNKENVPTMACLSPSKLFESTSPPTCRPHEPFKKHSTLSPNSRIFSQSSLTF